MYDIEEIDAKDMGEENNGRWFSVIHNMTIIRARTEGDKNGKTISLFSQEGEVLGMNDETEGFYNAINKHINEEK